MLSIHCDYECCLRVIEGTAVCRATLRSERVYVWYVYQVDLLDEYGSEEGDGGECDGCCEGWHAWLG